MASTKPQAAPAQLSAPGASGVPARPRGEGRSWLWSLIIGLLILGAMGTVPQQNDPGALYNWTLVALFCCLAQSWNLIGGFVGYAAFGNVVFFGIGAYAVPLALQHNLPNLHSFIHPLDHVIASKSRNAGCHHGFHFHAGFGGSCDFGGNSDAILA